MATNADGSITIDTRIDQSGFNAGVKKIAASAAEALNGVLFQTVRIGETVKGVISRVVSTVGRIASGIGNILKKAILGTFIVLALSIQKIFQSLRESFTSLLNLGENATLKKDIENIQNSFTELRAAIINAFLPLITAAVPYIKQALSWLIELFNKVAQITAAFMGQKQALQIIQGSAQKIADANKKTEKAAKGQLAAFDQINVLQQQETTGPDVSELPTVAAEMVPITDDILDRVQAIKNEIAEWWADPIGKLKETWGKIVDWFKTNVLGPIIEWWNNTWLGNLLNKLWDNFVNTWKGIWENSKQTFEAIKQNVILAFTGIKKFLTGIFTGDWKLALQGLKDIAAGVFGAIFEFIKGATRNLLILFEGWKNQVIIIWNALPQPIKDAFNNALQFVKNIWLGIGDWFRNNVTNPIKNVFDNALNGISNSFVAVFSGIVNFVSSIVGNIINLINSMTTSIVSSLNSISSFIGVPAVSPIATIPPPRRTGGGHRPPRLATGAVIPPNAQFAAILGDQRSGTNLEAPADLIRQIIMEALNNNQQQTNVKVTFEGTLGALVRELKPHIEAENTRVGGSLVKK